MALFITLLIMVAIGYYLYNILYVNKEFFDTFPEVPVPPPVTKPVLVEKPVEDPAPVSTPVSLTKHKK